MADPEPHPLPPLALETISLPITVMQDRWLRVYLSRHQPLHFGKACRYRFDDPEPDPGKRFGVLYVGDCLDCCLIEAFFNRTGDDLVLDRWVLAERSLATIEPREPLRLVDLSGPGLMKLHADNRLCDGERAMARSWSAAFYRHPDQPDGILYRSRHHPGLLCAAIYERSAGRIALAGLPQPLLGAELAEAVLVTLERYGILVLSD